TRKAVLANLPEGDWPEGQLLEDQQVLDHCNTLPRRKSKKARSLMAGMSGAQVFELEDEYGRGAIFKIFVSAEEMLLDVTALEVIAATRGQPLRSVAVEHAG